MAKRGLDLENQLKDVRRQLNDELACLDLRMDSKISLLSEFQEFFKRRGEVEYEYARSLERLCEKFERNTKQRNLRNEVRSTFNLWSTVLAETRKLSRERANLAELYASEMISRLDIMTRDVHVLSKKCKEIMVEVQDQYLKTLRDFSEQTKAYQQSCHNTSEANRKLTKYKETASTARSQSAKKKAESKTRERQRQFKVQKHLQLKNRNDYLLAIARCNTFSMQYFNMDVMDIIEYMDFDYHDSFRRLMKAQQEAERETCDAILSSVGNLMEHSKTLNFEGDLHYFLSEYPQPFTPPPPLVFTPFESDEVSEFKVNTEDIFRKARKEVTLLQEEIQTLQIQREEDIKTVQHMEAVNLRKYQVTTVDDALALLEDSSDPLPWDLNSSGGRGTASLERGLSLTTKGGQALQMSQKGKKDNMHFTLGVLQRRIHRSDRLALCAAQVDILEKSLDEQKVPPVPVGKDEHGNSVPGEVPRLFGGDVLEYIMATGCDIPLIVQSCVRTIDREGLTMEGLFRVPGPAAYTDELRLAFEEGRDPLAVTGTKKADIAGVASTLKAYFRELRPPLFPTDKYTRFIECIHHEDIHVKMDAVRDTVNTLHPAVVTVMRFLFKFLHKVSQYSAESKMGSANLALVFGPTLMRAPDSCDPRQLHNDVPSVNMLIQLCIDRYEYIFGEEDDEEVVHSGSASPPDHLPAELPVTPETPDDTTLPPPPAVPQDLGPALRTARETSPSPPHSSFQMPPPPDPTPPAAVEPVVVELPPIPPRPVSFSPEMSSFSQEASIEKPPMPLPGMEIEEPQPVSESTISQELSSLDKTMEELQISLADIEEVAPPPITVTTPGATEMPVLEITAQAEGDKLKEEEEEEPKTEVLTDEATDDESESEDETMKMISAQALYDYTARSDKELSFKRGDTLFVTEKTTDQKWWDGFSPDRRRGFIPATYVEIVELSSVTAKPPGDVEEVAVMSRPQPPQRKSSMAESGERSPELFISEPPIHEEEEAEAEGENGDKTPELLSPVASSADVAAGDRAAPEATPPPRPSDPRERSPTPEVPGRATGIVAEKLDSEEAAGEPPKAKPTVHIASGAVRKMTQQFHEHTQQTTSTGGRILVEPHTHRRQHSSDLSPRKPAPDPEHPRTASASAANKDHQRTSSTGNKVTALSSAFQAKPPPPLRPKPPHHFSPLHQAPPPSSEAVPPGTFPIMSHSSAVSVSPIQKAAAAAQGQLPKKPQPPLSRPKASSKKRQGSLKDKDREERKSAKPPTASKPPALFPATSPGKGNPEFKADIAAALAARLKAKEEHK